MLTDEELPPPPDPIADGEGFLDDLYSERQMREYARAVERAAYEVAIKACENEKRISARTFDDDIHDEACEACADAIHSLMQEQPK